MGKPANNPCLSDEDVRSLASIAGVYDNEAISSLHDWLENKTANARKTPDLADRLRDSEDAAREEIKPILDTVREFMSALRTAPNALERIRMLYAEELSEEQIVEFESQGQRRLDQDLKGLARLAAAIQATEDNINAEECTGPALLGPKTVAYELAQKYVEISYQPFHYYVPETHSTCSPWSHPHTSPGTRFVAGALKKMFPSLNDTNLKNILKEIPQFTNGALKRA